MLRTLTSWRLLTCGLVVAVLALAGLAMSLERQQSDRTLRQGIADAELISELLLELHLRRQDADVHELREEVQRTIDEGVRLLQAEGRLVGLQLWGEDGHLLYSDNDDPEELSADERQGLVAVLAGRPHVEFEHDADRAVPTATVLMQPENEEDLPSGLVAEVLLPQDEIASSLATTARWLYGGAGLLMVVLTILAVVVRRRLLRREHEATHDPLTALGNRTLLASASHRLLACSGRRDQGQGQGQVALLLLDLDGFKTVNDTLGHAVGDKLLVEVASTLRGAARPDDVVVRLGGDEFAVLLQNMPDTDAAVRAAENISQALHRPFTVDRVTLEVGASIGVAVAPEHGQDLDALLRRADVAMYQAKREGSGVRLYDEAKDPHDEEQLGLLSQLRSAIEEGQLRLHFQPKMSLREGRTVGFEALVRWEHPQRGLLAPGAFIPLAERTALMRPLTTWVLRTAVAQCAAWRAEGWEVDVAVNIAPATLLEPEFPSQVMQVLADAGLPGSALELEITETAVMIDPARAADTLRRLQAMGVAVSIDDFGAGYTSLSYLKSLPVRSLKIDRGFVTHLIENGKDEAVARSIVSLGHDLGLNVVAEGVETSDVRQRLLELGCDEIQGYLLSRPIPSADVALWLAQQHGHRRQADTPARTA
ncbi:MAG: EAL domain-containing protein [Actinomycetota bacterium]|nr:EAL domain-containing protein [Actinomycetota bacterium]